MRRYQITVDGRTFDVRLLSDPQQEQVQVEVDGQTLVVEIETVASEDTTTPLAPAAVSAPAADTELSPASQAASPSDRVVAAPLPGVIKSVAVRLEQPVSVGDELLVIEAMKMDNIIRATRSGVVEVILVVEGNHVVHGQPMVQYRE